VRGRPGLRISPALLGSRPARSPAPHRPRLRSRHWSHHAVPGDAMSAADHGPADSPLTREQVLDELEFLAKVEHARAIPAARVPISRSARPGWPSSSSWQRASRPSPRPSTTGMRGWSRRSRPP